MNVQAMPKTAYDKTLFTEKANELIEIGAFFDASGWAPATSGNYSARIDDKYAAITVSGYPKGRLDMDGIMAVDMDGRATDTRKPSAETLLHTMIYTLKPEAGAVLHTHSVNAVVLSRLMKKSKLKLEDYELLKAFPGIETHESSVCVPIFDNTQDIAALSELVREKLEEKTNVFGFLIRSHGLYAWGKDVAEAARAIEAFEFLFTCELEQRKYA